jgi:hypothetical protein
VPHRAQESGAFIRKEEMAPGEFRLPERKGDGAMLAKKGNLDEPRMILLLDQHEYPHDVADQVRASLGHRIEEHRRLERRVLELGIPLVQIVGSHDETGQVRSPTKR